MFSTIFFFTLGFSPRSALIWNDNFKEKYKWVHLKKSTTNKTIEFNSKLWYSSYFIVLLFIINLLFLPHVPNYTTILYLNKCWTYLTKSIMPVFSMALKIPFHEASIQYLCFGVNGNRGSEGGGGIYNGSLTGNLSDDVNLLNSQPMTSIFNFQLLYRHNQNFFFI